MKTKFTKKPKVEVSQETIDAHGKPGKEKLIAKNVEIMFHGQGMIKTDILVNEEGNLVLPGILLGKGTVNGVEDQWILTYSAGHDDEIMFGDHPM